MSKYIYSFFVVAGLILSTNSVRADEVQNTTTRTESPDYNSSSSTTTKTEDVPTTVKQETSYSESSPGSDKQVTTKRRYTVPKKQKTVTRQTETQVNN